jgi:ABC-type branched-subunit amino acid transport system substrate-binding protein
MKKRSKRRAAIFYTPDSYSRQLSDAFAKQFRRKGGTVVAQINLHSKGGIRAAAAKAARAIAVPLVATSRGFSAGCRAARVWATAGSRAPWM